MPQIWQHLLLAVIINLLLGTTALVLRLVSWSGYISGLAVGIIIFTSAGVGAYVILCTFFALGTAFSKLGLAAKRARGTQQKEGGRRGGHALANCAVGVFSALLSVILPHPEIYLLALTSAFATALSDTTANELGQIFGKHPILPTSFKRVLPGTDGAVSIEGTLLGILASLVIATIGILFSLINWWGFLAVVIAAFLGTTLESIIGATRAKILGNEVLNLLNTFTGAILAVGIYLLCNYLYLGDLWAN
jgi:uncharacterized protein (TIGR00297 family)